MILRRGAHLLLHDPVGGKFVDPRLGHALRVTHLVEEIESPRASLIGIFCSPALAPTGNASAWRTRSNRPGFSVFTDGAVPVMDLGSRLVPDLEVLARSSATFSSLKEILPCHPL
ncbi:MAG: hypothetical protein KatS3mg077_1155 [Candidatus Binatia bacterium]|nr:MAG: hypothetical protein KatS3mg077_1155 [Candidatus Binatia bacterium]